MKLMKVVFDLGYVVDGENPEMVAEAKDAIYEDIMNAFKFEEVANYMELVDAPDATEHDIPDFLLPDPEDDDDEAQSSRFSQRTAR